MEITLSGECTWVGGYLYSSSLLQYCYGLAGSEKENNQDHLKI